VVVHVRDISHPHTDFQKQTVLKVMQEVGVKEELLETRYMEVWNKVDLIKDDQMQWLNDKIEAETEESEFPIVMLSATEGYNKQVFLQTVSQMVA
jgi:50S ribosomal subunit-associated GTPase HflX